MRAHPTLLQLHAEEQAEAARAVQREAERRALLAAYEDEVRMLKAELWRWALLVLMLAAAATLFALS